MEFPGSSEFLRTTNSRPGTKHGDRSRWQQAFNKQIHDFSIVIGIIPATTTPSSAGPTSPMRQNRIPCQKTSFLPHMRHDPPCSILLLHANYHPKTQSQTARPCPTTVSFDLVTCRPGCRMARYMHARHHAIDISKFFKLYAVQFRTNSHLPSFSVM